jgi:branched-chain amino acid transport system substrate-binding protein
MITPTSLSDKIKDDPYIFRMLSYITSINNLSEYIEQESPNSIVGTCIDPGIPDKNSLMAQFKSISNNQIVKLSFCEEFLDPLKDSNSDNNDVIEDVIEEINKKQINSLVLVPYVDRIPKIMEILQAISYNKLSIRLYGNSTFFTNETLEEKQAAKGLTLSVPWYPNKNEPKLPFQKEFEQLYQDRTDNWRTAMAYDATRIIIQGLEQISQKQQQIGREQLNNVLRREKFIYYGVTGKTTFDDSGVNENQSDARIQIKNGQFEKISSE